MNKTALQISASDALFSGWSSFIAFPKNAAVMFGGKDLYGTPP
jgi:hypothetical protein